MKYFFIWVIIAVSTAVECKMDQFTQECLDAHNEYRRQHGAPPLTISSELMKMAQNWAQTLARSGTFDHSSNSGDVGENLYKAMPLKNGRQAVDSWYNEIKIYNWNRPGTGSGDIGHFTQVVWKGSTELGVGFAKGRDGLTNVVCNYAPAGNMMGEYKDNVLPRGTPYIDPNASNKPEPEEEGPEKGSPKEEGPEEEVPEEEAPEEEAPEEEVPEEEAPEEEVPEEEVPEEEAPEEEVPEEEVPEEEVPEEEVPEEEAPEEEVPEEEAPEEEVPEEEEAEEAPAAAKEEGEFQYEDEDPEKKASVEEKEPEKPPVAAEKENEYQYED